MIKINGFYSAAAGCWLADFTNDWLAELVHGTTQFELNFYADAEPDAVFDHLAQRYPNARIMVCYEVV